MDRSTAPGKAKAGAVVLSLSRRHERAGGRQEKIMVIGKIMKNMVVKAGGAV
jgi:hypothetical protein